MRKILSLFLVVCMIFSMSAVVFADDSHMTEIKYVGEGISEWELDVPKTMAPGDTGVVELSGTWSSEETVVVSAPDKVTLTNELDEDTKDLTVTFGSLEVVGDNTDSILETKNISVSDISDALFGTWKGYIIYSVKVEEINPLIHNGVIPEGGTYYVGLEFEPEEWKTAIATYTAGDKFPNTINRGDIYIYGDYMYKYEWSYLSGCWGGGDCLPNGWGVAVLNSEKSQYEDVLLEINNKPIINMDSTYQGCWLLEKVPEIPSTVTSIGNLCAGCGVITSAPVIPEGVTYMRSAFADCTSLVVPPVIPKSVINMAYTLSGCTSLTGEIEINASNLETYEGCFGYIENPIVLTGSCPQLEEIAAQYDYVTVK